MSDDALIEAMMDAAFGRADLPSIVVAMMRKAMIDALAVARKAILEEAAAVADDIAKRLEGIANSQELRMRPDDAAETWARIRALSQHEAGPRIDGAKAILAKAREATP